MTMGFESAWAADLHAFLEFKRALGYRYQRAEFTLRALDRYLVRSPPMRDGQRLHQSILAWLGRRPGRNAISVVGELAVVRQFYAFLRRQGRHRLPEPAWPQMRATSDYLPHIFSTAEVRRLLGLARQLGGHPFRRVTYRMLILLLYCTGLRLGEAVRLRLCNVDLATGTLFVVASKGRSRWVPCHRTLCHELGGYLTTRRAFARAGPAAFLFVGLDRTSRPTNRLTTRNASDGLRALLRTAGLKPAAGRVGPRPYDFRHAFAVHRLTRWYRDGVDLQARLPWLSAYMGHDDLLGTETYLTATPELLALAAGRFRRRYTAPLAVR